METAEEARSECRTLIGQGDYAAAVRSAKLSTELAPADPASWAHLSESFLHWERYDECRASADRGLSIDPTACELWKVKADAELMSGDIDAGLDSFARAVECGHWDKDGFLTALLAHGELGRAERELIRRRENEGTTPVLDLAEASLLHDRVLQEHWVEVDQEDGGRVYIPTAFAALEEMQGAIDAMQALPASEAIEELAASSQAAVDDQLKRRYGGGVAIPLASLAVGLVLLMASDADPNLAFAGAVYLLCVPLYLHAARVQTFRLSVRRAAGEDGGGGFLSEMTRGEGIGAGIAAFLMAFSCLGVMAPGVVLYHYTRNYLLK